ASFDTTLGVYTGNSVGGLTEVASSDDAAGCPDSRSRATVNVTGGTTYRIAVAGYQGASGTFTLTSSFVGPPANDAFGSAQSITGTSGTENGTTVLATRQSGEPNPFSFLDKGSVWYGWTAPGTGTVTFDTCTAASYDTTLAAYTGAAVNALTTVASNDDSNTCGNGSARSQISFAATGGTTYRIAVAGFTEGGGTFTLTWNQVVPPPANDAIANAQTITGITGTTNGTTAGATFEGTEPQHFPDLADTRSVWYSYTPSASGTLTLDTCATATDTGIAVYTGTPNSASTPLASNDDDGGCPSATFPARVSFPVTSGTTYRIAVVTFDIAADGGPFTLAW
ncbi:hypothetical protein B7486_61610, partial [cyanobacterium TDX16]